MDRVLASATTPVFTRFREFSKVRPGVASITVCHSMISVWLFTCNIRYQKGQPGTRPGEGIRPGVAEGTQDYVLPSSAVPTGLLLSGLDLPRISSWATFSRPSGTALVWVGFTQDFILGYFQPSLRDCSCLGWSYPGFHPGLLSAVPTGLLLSGLDLPRILSWATFSQSCPN
jgi:hypothetical protein